MYGSLPAKAVFTRGQRVPVQKSLFLSRVFIEIYRIKEFTGRGRVVSGRLLWFNDRIMKMIRHKNPAVTVLTFDRLDKLPESVSLAG